MKPLINRLGTTRTLDDQQVVFVKMMEFFKKGS